MIKLKHFCKILWKIWKLTQNIASNSASEVEIYPQSVAED